MNSSRVILSRVIVVWKGSTRLSKPNSVNGGGSLNSSRTSLPDMSGSCEETDCMALYWCFVDKKRVNRGIPCSTKSARLSWPKRDHKSPCLSACGSYRTSASSTTRTTRGSSAFTMETYCKNFEQVTKEASYRNIQNPVPLQALGCQSRMRVLMKGRAWRSWI
jgi:hypothetical protein